MPLKVPLLDLQAQLESIRPELNPAIEAVINSTAYIMGPEIGKLERTISTYCDSQFGIAVSSGTDALLVSLMALDLEPGEFVITSPYSFFATAGVVARLRATPLFVDIDPLTYNICPRALATFLEHSDKKGKIKAIIPVHLYGQCADMDPIKEVGELYGIPIIEDSAQAIGARYPSKHGVKKAGSIGLAGCLSFFPSKNLGAMGDGGMVVTNDKAFAEKITSLRNHGANPKYYHSLIGGNFRLDTLQAAVLLVKFGHLSRWHEMRQNNAAFYDQHIQVEQIKKPPIAYQREYHIYNQYVISVGEKRDELRAFLTAHNVGTEIYYPVPFHLQECFSSLGYKKGDFPQSEFAAAHSLALPIYPELTTEMQQYVVETLQSFYQ